MTAVPPTKTGEALPRRHDQGARSRLPDLYIFPQHARPRFARENIAGLVNGAELRSAARRGRGIAALIEDEVFHPAVERVADPDALLVTRIVDIVRLRIEDIDQV